VKRLRVPLDALVAGPRVLDEKAARYVTRVHRLGVGDTFLGFDPASAVEAEVEIVSAGKRAQCAVGEVVPSTAPKGDSVTLIQCLGKGDKPERVVSAATALGAQRIHFVESERSVVVAGDRGAAKLGRYRAVAVEAARQCGRGDVPAVTGPTSLLEAVAAPDGALRICLAPGASRTLSEVLSSRDQRPLVLLVGPEGGFTDGELELCGMHGFVGATLGEHVLRTELAAMAALGAVAAFRRA